MDNRRSGHVQDPYRILGVSRGATPAQIASAYRRLLRQHHPDTGIADADRLGQVQAAYAQLRAPAAHARAAGRHIRSTSGTSAEMATQASAGGVFLGEDSQTRSAQRRRIPIARRGTDLFAAVTITTAQARTGATITIRIPTASARTLRIQIPAGTHDGQILCVSRHGAPGQNGGPAGDLHLNVCLRDSDPEAI